MRKRIGLLLAQLEENTQNRFVKAFIREAYAHDYDVCIFSMLQKYQETPLRNVGDSNIFTLIRFEAFDGLVVLADTIQTPNFEGKLLKRIKASYDGPVIVVDKETDLFDYVLMDHYSPIVEIMNHMIDVHGYQKIAFLGGRKGHPHSVQRLNAFRDAMKAHNLPIREDWIYHGNYWYNGGNEFAEILLAHKDDMPEAIVCANDCMAIGLAGSLSDAGLRIPEDIAIAGYDSIAEGKTAPVPLTSADIPAPACGELCFHKLHAAITGEEVKLPKLKADILIGGSCGCKDYQTIYTKANRDRWQTDHSVVSYYSDFNHLTEDLLCQTKYEHFFEIIAKYSYQIRPFKNLWLCFNDGFTNPAGFIGDEARRISYSSTMHMVIKCGPDSNASPASCVDLNRTFDSALMLPELWEEREYPTTFIFTPMFFEDICFGFAAFNEGETINFYNETYRVWMRNVNLGLEAFYRQKAMLQLIDQIKADQVRDKQTGLYNYQGFHNRLTALAKPQTGKGRALAVIAFDLDDLKGINEFFGRQGGDCAIHALAVFLNRITADKEVCGRLGNDEFLLGFISENCEQRYNEITTLIPEEGLLYHDPNGGDQYVNIHHAMITNSLNVMPELDFIINQAINANNYKKKAERDTLEEQQDMTAEVAAKCRLVSEILENSLLTYVFQPIVKVSDGEIYGYEALMRYFGDTPLNPSEILSCAERMNRLYDIEKATFNGVISYVEEHDSDFRGRKIFINSLPAHQLQGRDEEVLKERIKQHPGRIVVEYTEGSEIEDAALVKRNEDFSELNVEVALDDYGSGYSNVNNLLRYTPKYVKIDRMLISGIQDDAQKRHFVKSIIDYAGKSNILVLAEGVETVEEMRTVIALGVDLIQGFYTGRPAKEPVSAIDEKIRSQIKRFSYFSLTSPSA